MVSFRDPIHGDLTFNGVLEEVILTTEFQRLARVKQLGLTNRVYTSAQHTRFDHSLGACYLAGRLAVNLGVPEKDALLIQVAALLHDVGHYDFSHALEPLAPYDHEENSRRIILGEISMPWCVAGEIRRALEKHGIDPTQLVALLSGGGGFPKHYSSIISSAVIDVDRMDYLVRDTHFTGAVIGTIDVSRLLNVLVVSPDGAIGVLEKGVASMEQFLLARLHMYRQVYLHPDSYSGEAMLMEAARRSMDVARPLLYGDEFLLHALLERGDPISQALIRRILSGKRAFYREAIAIYPGERAASMGFGKTGAERMLAAHSLRGRLSQVTGLPEHELLVTIHPAKVSTYPAFPVLMRDGKWIDLFSHPEQLPEEWKDVSELARTIMQQQTNRRAISIFTPAEHVQAVRDALNEMS